MRLLIKNSGSCYQNVSIDCFQMHIDDVWWHDFKNRERQFFDGTNAKVKQCSGGKCNCDGTLEWKHDDGKITADWLLPITGFTSSEYARSSYFFQSYDPAANRSS